MAVTQTGTDLMAAIQKRLQSQGIRQPDDQRMSLMLDIMNTINVDSADVLSDAVTELANNPQRPFVFGA